MRILEFRVWGFGLLGCGVYGLQGLGFGLRRWFFVSQDAIFLTA